MYRVPVINVFRAAIIQTLEANNALLPFMTVPLLGFPQDTYEASCQNLNWHWTFTGLSYYPRSKDMYISDWKLRLGGPGGPPLYQVKFHSRLESKPEHLKETAGVIRQLLYGSDTRAVRRTRSGLFPAFPDSSLYPTIP